VVSVTDPHGRNLGFLHPHVYSRNNNGLLNTPEDCVSLLFSIIINQGFHRLNFGHEFHIPKQKKNVHIKLCSQTFNLRVPAERILRRNQQQLGVIVWAGVVGDCLVDLHVLPHRHTGRHC
jgi:hypothetical protein